MVAWTDLYLLATTIISFLLCSNAFVIHESKNCGNTNCGEGEVCVTQTVQCVRAPCPPIQTCMPAPPQTCESVGSDYCQPGYYCQDTDCNSTEGPICVKEDPCYYIQCESGSHCADGECIEDPTCDDFICAPDEECYHKYIECGGCRENSCCSPIPCCRPINKSCDYQNGCSCDNGCENDCSCDNDCENNCGTAFDCDSCDNSPVIQPGDPVPVGDGCNCTGSAQPLPPPPNPVGNSSSCNSSCSTEYDCDHCDNSPVVQPGDPVPVGDGCNCTGSAQPLRPSPYPVGNGSSCNDSCGTQYDSGCFDNISVPEDNGFNCTSSVQTLPPPSYTNGNGYGCDITV